MPWESLIYIFIKKSRGYTKEIAFSKKYFQKKKTFVGGLGLSILTVTYSAYTMYMFYVGLIWSNQMKIIILSCNTQKIFYGRRKLNLQFHENVFWMELKIMSIFRWFWTKYLLSKWSKFFLDVLRACCNYEKLALTSGKYRALWFSSVRHVYDVLMTKIFNLPIFVSNLSWISRTVYEGPQPPSRTESIISLFSWRSTRLRSRKETRQEPWRSRVTINKLEGPSMKYAII